MSARSIGHPIDPLTIIVSLEEQVNDNAQRVDNAMRNLVDLARAVRSVLQKVEELHEKVDLSLAVPEPSLAGSEFAAGLERYSQVVSHLQSMQELLSQRVEQVENKETPQPVDYAPEFQRTEAILENMRLQHELLRAEIQRELQSGGRPPAELELTLQELRAQQNILNEQLADFGKLQQAHYRILSELQNTQPKLAQKLNDFTRKYPEGSIASIDDVRRLAGAVDKMAQEHSQFSGKLEEYRQLKDSSALLTILKSEHIALQKRLDLVEAGGSTGEGSGFSSEELGKLRSLLDDLARQHNDLQTRVAGLVEEYKEQPDAGMQLETLLAPLTERLTAVESDRQKGETTAALDKLASSLAEVERERADVARQLEDFANQHAEFEKQHAAQDDAMAKLAATQASLEQSLTEQKLQTPAGVEETAAGLRRIESTVTDLTAQLKALSDQQQVQFDALATIESAQAPVVQRIAELESREIPHATDHSAELVDVKASVAGLAEQQDQLQTELKAFAVQQYEKLGVLDTLHEAQTPLLQRIAELEQREFPKPVDTTAEIVELHTGLEKLTREQVTVRDELKALAAQHADRSETLIQIESVQAPLLARITDLEAREPEKPVDNTSELLEIKQAIQQVTGRQSQLQTELGSLADRQASRFDELAALESAQAPLLRRIEELESREPAKPADYSPHIEKLQTALDAIRQQHTDLQSEIKALAEQHAAKATALGSLEAAQAPLLQRLVELEAREPVQVVAGSDDANELQGAFEGLARHQEQLHKDLQSLADQQHVHLDTLAALETGIAPLAQRLAEVEARKLPERVDHSGELGQLQSVLDRLTMQQDQLRDQLSHYADQQQISKLMEHLAELQARLARNSEQLLSLEQNRSQGQDEQRKQLQTQLDMQERQRALLEEIQVRLELQQEDLAAQKAQVAEFVALAKEAAEKKRRASDEPHADPSVGPLIESALHIERGEYAEAVRCLEAAQQMGDNPKLEQALKLARRMLEQQNKPKPQA